VTVRFGVIGTGFWADTVHATGLAAHPEVQLVGIWGRDPARAAAVAERHGVQAFVDLAALLRRVDAVAVAVAPDVQAEIAVRAARTGCHLLLEKPLALSATDAGGLELAVEQAGVASVVFFTSRFTPGTAAWFRDVVTPGEWDGGRVTLLASIFSPGNPFGTSPWRRERGALWDVGPHALASLLPGLGPVEEVVAVHGRGDTVHLSLCHAGGRASSVELSLTAADSAVLSETVFWGPSGVARRPEDAGAVTEGFAAAVSALLEAIDSGEGHPCGVRTGAEIVRVLAAAETFLARAADRRGERPEAPGR
jgi:predicted dehydrogenase